MSRRVTVQRQDTAPTRAASVDTGRVLVAAIANKGLLDPSRPGHSLDDIKTRHGSKQSFSNLIDGTELYFREGGYEMFVTPVWGPAVATAQAIGAAGWAQLNIAGTSGTALVAIANSPGDWANGATGGYTIEVVNGPINGSTHRQLIVRLNSVEVARSSEFNANTAVNNVKLDDLTILLGAGSGLPPVAAAANLTGGTLDRTNITATQVLAALDRAPEDMGPMNVVLADWQDATNHTNARAHSAARGRYLLPDAVDTTAKTTLTTAGTAEKGQTNGERSNALLAPWLSIAGTAGGTTRSVPLSFFVAAKAAQTDRVAGPAQAPAGYYGRQTSSLVLDVKAKFTNAEQAELEAAGVALAIVENGLVMFDTNRTLVDPAGADSEWKQMSVARYIMGLEARLKVAAAPFAHRPNTPKMRAELNTALTGELMRDEQNEQLLLREGEPPGSSYIVDTSSNVNTDAVIAGGKAIAAVGVRPAPGTDFIQILLTNVAAGDPVAA